MSLQTGAFPLHCPSLPQRRTVSPSIVSNPDAQMYVASLPCDVDVTCTVVLSSALGWPHSAMERDHTMC